MPGYLKNAARSADGTTIGYRQYGSGPGLILVHGGMQAAQHMSALAAALADQFRVFVPDRRGRGPSGPHGAGFGLRREVEDLQALIAATGARFLFGPAQVPSSRCGPRWSPRDWNGSPSTNRRYRSAARPRPPGCRASTRKSRQARTPPPR